MESEAAAAAAALAAAVVVQAAAATVETAALVGEAAAAAEEEEGEAAAAKGKRTALPGLGGIPSPGSPLNSLRPPLRLEGALLTSWALAGRPLLPLTLPPSASFLPQWRGRVGGPPKSSRPSGGGVPRAGPGLRGVCV